MITSFKSLARPRRAAKSVCTYIPGTKLSEAQSVVAFMCGYNSWDALKSATEASNAQASPDDEDLSPADLEARIKFQVEQVRGYLKNSPKQARELVRLTSPTVRNPVSASVDPDANMPMLRGTAIYMPSPFTRFSPRYPDLFGFLYDVDHLRLEFVQSDEHSFVSEHIASTLEFRFSNGERLKLSGVYFWKFLDSIPNELADAHGEWLEHNPYSSGPTERLMARLRMGYSCLFSTSPDNKLFVEPPPVYVDIDFKTATVTRRNPVRLQSSTKNSFYAIFDQAASRATEHLQSAVDQFVIKSISGPRTELQLVNKGGRGSKAFGNEYVKSTWSGTGHWTIEDLMMEFSPEQLSPSGCGGNLRYRKIFDREMAQHFRNSLSEACLIAVDSPELYAAMLHELEIRTPSSRAKAETRATRIADGLLATNARLDLAFTFSQVLIKRQAGRTFNSWVPTLKSDASKRRPTALLEEVLNKNKKSTGDH